MNQPIGDAAVQNAVARHHAWIGNFYTVTPEIYRGLAQLYVEHPEVRPNYDKVKIGLGDFIQTAMLYYCDHTLAK